MPGGELTSVLGPQRLIGPLPDSFRTISGHYGCQSCRACVGGYSAEDDREPSSPAKSWRSPPSRRSAGSGRWDIGKAGQILPHQFPSPRPGLPFLGFAEKRRPCRNRAPPAPRPATGDPGCPPPGPSFGPSRRSVSALHVSRGDRPRRTPLIQVSNPRPSARFRGFPPGAATDQLRYPE